MPTAPYPAQWRESEALPWLAAIVESSDDAIVGKDLNGTILSWNSGAARVYGYSAEEAVGRSAAMLISPDRPDEETLILQKIRQGQRVEHYETVRIRKDGSRVDVSMTISPIRASSGEVVGASSISRDISERKRAEAQMKRSLAEKEALLREIHHRVKNNLQVISSLLELQAAQASDGALIQGFRESQSRIRTMALIHEKLYETPDLARVDFSGYLDSLLRMILRSQQSARDPRLAVDCEQLIVGTDTAVPLGLIINELVSNCLKHAFKNSEADPVITIALINEAAGVYLLVVQDNGSGFPAGFDPASSRSLGLRLVHILTDQIGGRLSRGTGASGTRFELRFSPVP